MIKVKSVTLAANKLLFEVPQTKGISGDKKQFIDVELSTEQLELLKKQLSQSDI